MSYLDPLKVRETHFDEAGASMRVIAHSAQTVDPVSLATTVEATAGPLTVTGAALGDEVTAIAPYDLQGIMVTAWVSAANAVSMRLRNGTGGTIDLASGTWRFIVKRWATLRV